MQNLSHVMLTVPRTHGAPANSRQKYSDTDTIRYVKVKRLVVQLLLFWKYLKTHAGGSFLKIFSVYY